MVAHVLRTPRRRRPAARPGQAGFAVVAIVLLVALILTVSTTFVVHVVAESQSAPAGTGAFDAPEALHSGLSFVRQEQSVGKDAGSLCVSSQGLAATLSTFALGEGRSRCDLQSLDANGLGRTVLAETVRTPTGQPDYTHPDQLPRLSTETVQALLDDPDVPLVSYGGRTTLQDTEITGLVVIENGGALTLDGVVVHGVVVSEDVLLDQPFGALDLATVPVLLIEGLVRFEAADFLPGVSVVMPDGILTTSSADARLMIEGDVVAHRVTLDRPGTLQGNVASVDPLELHVDLDRPGAGRGARAWSEALLVTAGWETGFLAFLPREANCEQLAPARDYWDDAGAETQVDP